MVLPFCRLHRAFALLFFKIFLHYLLDFIPLDFVVVRGSIAEEVDRECHRAERICTFCAAENNKKR